MSDRLYSWIIGTAFVIGAVAIGWLLVFGKVPAQATNGSHPTAAMTETAKMISQTKHHH